MDNTRIYFFDKKRKIFLEQDNYSYNGKHDESQSWIEFKEPIKFEWRNDDPPKYVDLLCKIADVYFVTIFDGIQNGWYSAYINEKVSEGHKLKWSYIPEE